MGFRTRSATPGTILCLVATILLAVVSFNTPLLKSLYFLEARYSEGQYAGTLRLGTLGYCLTFQGTETCVGPTVGYNFNPNTIFNISQFQIPEAITKYLTYALILHIIALAFAAGGTIFGLLSHISTLSLLCFPTCTASLASTFSLLALIFDLVIFYIAKSRIDSVSGASASIGISVWLTLAAWLCAGFSGCAYGIGRCCVGARRNDRSGGGDPSSSGGKYAPYANPGGAGGMDDMRMHAIRDEQIRKQNQKEQGLPSFSELERQPLTAGGADKDEYVTYEDDRVGRMPGGMPPQGQAGRNGLARDGSVLNGVGVGYGRRTPRDEQQQGGHTLGYGGGYAPSMISSAGAAGVGAGGGGVERAPQNNYYNDPYAHPGQNEPAYNQDPYGRAQTYNPGPNSYSEANYRPEGPQSAGIEDDQYASGDPNQSMESAYNGQPYGQQQPNPTARVDPYDAYGGYEHDRDQGLSGIGMAAAGVAAGAAGAGAYHASQGQGQGQGHAYPPQQSRSPVYGDHQQQQQQQQQQYGQGVRGGQAGQGLSPINTQPTMGGFGTYGSQLNTHSDPYYQQQQQQQQQHTPIHQPQPQHLTGINSFTGQPELLRSPVSEVSSLSAYPSTQQQHQQGYQQSNLNGASAYASLAPAAAAAHRYVNANSNGNGYDQQELMRDEGYSGGAPVDRPPSYGNVPSGGYRPQPEKSQYQAR